MAKDTVEVKIVAKDDTKKGITKATKSFSNMAKTLGPLIAAGFGIAAVKAVTDAYVRQEDAIAQLDARLKSTGNTVGLTSKQLQNMASSLQGVTRFGDEAIIEMQSLLLTFTKIGGETFPQATEAILNVSTAMGQDLQSAAIQVGKALNDPVLGVTALQRSGIQFTESQKEMIKTLVKTGDVVGAQTIILKELETQFGGAARAAKETLGGAMQSAENDMGDLAESIGAIMAPKLKELANLASDVAVSLREMIDPTVQGDLAAVNEEIEAMGGLLNDMAAEGVADNQIAFVEAQIDALVAKRVELEQTLTDINAPPDQQGGAGVGGDTQAQTEESLNVHLAIQEAQQIEDIWLGHAQRLAEIKTEEDAAALSQAIAQGEQLKDFWQIQADDQIAIEKNAADTIAQNKITAEKVVSDALGVISGLITSESEAAFKVGKAASIAQATINTYQSATGAYASLSGIPTVGPALGAAAAAAAIVAGLANVKKIQATTFQGGGSGGGGGGGGGGLGGSGGGGAGAGLPELTELQAGETPINQPPQLPPIIIEGGGLLGKIMEDEIFPEINKLLGRGFTLNLT